MTTSRQGVIGRTGARRRRSGWVVLVTIAGLLLAACGGEGGATSDGEHAATTSAVDAPAPEADPVPAAPSTTAPLETPSPVVDTTVPVALDDVGFIDADGTVGLEHALVAFALVVGPLPGVEPPEVPDGALPDGTEAIRWLMQHADALTPEQAEAAAAAISPRHADGTPVEAGPVGVRRPTGLRSAGPGPDPIVHVVNPCYLDSIALGGDLVGTEKYRGMIDRAVALLEPKLGRLGIPVYVGYRGPGAAAASASGFASDCSLPATRCTISINEGSIPDDFMEWAMVHEVVHCYQFSRIGIRAAQHVRPWVTEGFPNWASQSLGDPTYAQGDWKEYLTTPETSLFSRSYQAWPVWAHVERSGQDPWATFVPTLQAGADNMAALQATAGSAWKEFSETWAAGFVREPARGAAWDTSGPGITAHAATATPDALSQGGEITLEASLGASTFWHIELIDAQVVVIDLVAGVGRMSFNGGSDHLLTAIDEQPICMFNACLCPEGSPNASRSMLQANGIDALIALSGLDVAGRVVVNGLSLADYCGEVPPDLPAPELPALDPCLVGEWESADFTEPGTHGFPDAFGGAGAIVRIGADGVVAYDFDPMASLRATDQQLDVTFETASFGTAAGLLLAADGVIVTSQADLGDLVHTLTAGPVHQELGGGPAVYIVPSPGASYACFGPTWSMGVTVPTTDLEFEIVFYRL